MLKIEVQRRCIVVSRSRVAVAVHPQTGGAAPRAGSLALERRRPWRRQTAFKHTRARALAGTHACRGERGAPRRADERVFVPAARAGTSIHDEYRYSYTVFISLDTHEYSSKIGVDESVALLTAGESIPNDPGAGSPRVRGHVSLPRCSDGSAARLCSHPATDCRAAPRGPPPSTRSGLYARGSQPDQAPSRARDPARCVGSGAGPRRHGRARDVRQSRSRAPPGPASSGRPARAFTRLSPPRYLYCILYL